MGVWTVVGWTAFLIFVGAVLSQIKRTIRKRKAWKHCTLPMPFRYDRFTGCLRHLREIGHERPRVYAEIFKELGDDVGSFMIPPPELGVICASAIVTRDPEVVKHVLHTNMDSYIKTIPYARDCGLNILSDWLGDGIFSIDHGPHSKDGGHCWWSQRKLSSKIFSQRNFREFMTKVFIEHTHELLAKIDSAIKETPEDKYFDVQKFIFGTTMDIFGHIAFGVRMDTLNGKPDEYAVAQDKCMGNLTRILRGHGAPYVFGFTTLLPPPLHLPAISLWRKFFPSLREFDSAVKVQNEYTLGVIRARKEQLKKMEERGEKESEDLGNNLLSIFLSTVGEDGSPLPDEMLVDIFKNFFLAGRDTTACLMSWTLTLLAQNPDCEAELLREIKQTLHEGQVLDCECVSPSQMPYLHGVLHESLRLYPPVPLDPKACAVDDVLPDGTVVPKDTILVYFPFGMGRWGKLWPDPEKFNPRRWEEANPTPFEFPVFQAGRRICLGKDMALLEARLMLVMLLQRFTFTLDPDHPLTLSDSLTTCVLNGLWVKARPRQ